MLCAMFASRSRARAAAAVAAVALLAALTACSAGASSADFTGSWGSAKAGHPNVTIEDDGSFHGTDGCNRLTGKGTVSGHTFTFGRIASTLMACEDIDVWLSKASTAKVDGSDLVVFDESGDRLGALRKH
jgi:heat shock protein HslJ